MIYSHSEIYDFIEHFSFMPFKFLKESGNYQECSIAWFDKSKVETSESAFAVSYKTKDEIIEIEEKELPSCLEFYVNHDAYVMISNDDDSFPIDISDHPSIDLSYQSYLKEADVICIDALDYFHLEDFLTANLSDKKLISDFLEADPIFYIDSYTHRICVNLVRKTIYAKYIAVDGFPYADFMQTILVLTIKNGQQILSDYIYPFNINSLFLGKQLYVPQSGISITNYFPVNKRIISTHSPLIFANKKDTLDWVDFYNSLSVQEKKEAELIKNMIDKKIRELKSAFKK